MYARKATQNLIAALRLLEALKLQLEADDEAAVERSVQEFGMLVPVLAVFKMDRRANALVEAIRMRRLKQAEVVAETIAALREILQEHETSRDILL